MNDTDNGFDTATRWEMPVLQTVRKPLTLLELDDIEHSARAEGYACGHAEGYANGMAEARRIAAQIGGLLDSLTRPMAQLDAEVLSALSELAVNIAGALIGQAYRTDANLHVELARQALLLIGNDRRDVELRLHPDDLPVLKSLLDLPASTRLTADASLGRGDLRVHADGLRIDATIAARLQAALAAINDSGIPS